MIAEILEIEVEDGQVVCRVQTGTGEEVSAIMLLPLGVDTYPLVGDSVICHNVGSEWVAVAGDSGQREAEQGELIIFSRNSANSPMTKLVLRATAERVDIGTGALSVAVAENLKALWTQMILLFSLHTHPVVGGATGVPNQSLPQWDDTIISTVLKISG